MKQRRIVQKMKKYSFFIAIFISFVGSSQNYKGTITSNNEGLYKVMLSPEIRSVVKEDYGTVRIIGGNQQEVPYVLMHDRDKTFSIFKSLEIVSKRSLKDSVTSIVLNNKLGKKQDQLTFRIANTNVNKIYNVFGSDDGKDWFGLVSNKHLSNINTTGKTFIEKLIDFPLNTYKFIRVDFKDKNSLPINILDVGVYESKFLSQNPIKINAFKQENITLNSSRKTRLKFKSNTTQKINTISFSIDTKFFLRNVKVIVERTHKIKKRIETYEDVICSFQLSSKNKNTFELDNLNVKEFIIEIENEDNPPLEINKVELYQSPKFLIAYLNEKENYSLTINENKSTPSYDIGNFISKDIVFIEEALVTGFFKIEDQEEDIKKTLFWQTNIFMWICIVLGGVFVVYFAWGLLKDINKEETV